MFIAVGTPPDEDGSADLSHVLAVARSIGEQMDGLSNHRGINPPSRSERPIWVAAEVQSVLDARGVTTEFDVVSNPEFLKEGAAVEDFMKPDRIIGRNRQSTNGGTASLVV